ncbi:MAG: hypothetical protein M3O86_06510 [Actinomycetota bacterium]|nr:hypothetical protein [Actinomycetota bacterium]
MPVVELPMDELGAVMQTVAPFVHPDESRAIGNVLLTVEQGRRVWYATDGYRMTRLRGGRHDGEVHATLPPRVLHASPHSDADVTLTLPDADHEPLTLRWASSSCAAGPARTTTPTSARRSSGRWTSRTSPSRSMRA